MFCKTLNNSNANVPWMSNTWDILSLVNNFSNIISTVIKVLWKYWKIVVVETNAALTVLFYPVSVVWCNGHFNYDHNFQL